MDDYAGRVLADRYRLPVPPQDAYELVETRAFDTYSGQEVLVHQVPLPEVIDAEVVDEDGTGYAPHGASSGRATRRPADPAVRRAVEAAQAAAQIPDHPRLDQVFDVFAEAGSLWIVSELVAARPLAALLAEGPLSPYRAAEIGSDVLTALRALHAHGWTHRNITTRTVVVCDDGRVVLTGLAAGAAEEALCGYAPVPSADDEEQAYGGEAAGENDGGYGAYGGEGSPEDGSGDGAGAGAYADGIGGDGADGSDAAYGDDDGEAAYAAYAGDGDDAYGDDAAYGDGGDGAYGGDAVYGGGDAVYGGGDAVYGGGDAVYGEGAYGGDAAYDGGNAAYTFGDGGGAATSAGDGDRRGPVEAYGSHEAGGDGSGRPRPADHRGEAAGAGEPVARPALPAGTPPSAADVRAARAGAIAAYRAGARAAAHIGETGAVPVQRPTPEPAPRPASRAAQDPASQAGSPSASRAAQDPASQAGSPSASRTAQDPAPEAGSPFAPLPLGPAPAPAPAPVPAQGLGPEPHWWSQAADDDEDDPDDPDDAYPAPYRKGYGSEGGGPPRAMLAGTWSDGPHASRDASRPVPAGGGGPALPALPAGYTPAQAPDPARAPEPASGGWDGAGEPGDEPGPVYRGPATRLAAERARQARIAVVGAVTERWAPEQAGPVHENWRLAPPIGPSTDLWALGALLYRAVQGHAPYPEENAAELVQLVCAEPPAFAEECGPLRPVVESLLRQDPTERPDVEELSGWLRSLVRSAPEPDAGVGVIPLPSVDATKLPIVRRRGELVRRRRGGAAAGGRHRHRKGGGRQEVSGRDEAQAVRQQERYEPARTQDRTREQGYGQNRDQKRDQRRDHRQEFPQEHFHDELPQRAPRAPRPSRAPRGAGAGARSPRSLGLTLVLLVLLLLVGAVAYAVLFMPKDGDNAQPTGGRTVSPTNGPSAGPSAGSSAPPSSQPSGEPSSKPSSAKTTPPASTPSSPALAAGYTLRKDPEGFEVGVAEGWRRSPINDAGQVRYTGGDFVLIVVPGRDTVQADGSDPMAYQRTKERELQPWRDSSWSSASGLRRIEVGQQVMAVGQFTWQDTTGREVFVRNLALIEDGRYHVVQVIGPESERDKVSELYDQAVKAYRATR
ncbi:serine/threonine protein kinase [Streptomyces sp. NPDC090127]|uniref:serine/threonine protein kinase n=1 Tax=Streptomyces sp. NPDC090127 TaxID=3365953 RepID=UPI0037FA3A41